MSKRVRVVFELTMPHAASWNGKWSGADAGNYIFMDFAPGEYEKKWKNKIIGEWHYRWDDGWEACVSSRVINGDESRQLKRKNKGFSTYRWMVDSILLAGRIMTKGDLREYLAEQEATP